MCLDRLLICAHNVLNSAAKQVIKLAVVSNNYEEAVFFVMGARSQAPAWERNPQAPASLVPTLCVGTHPGRSASNAGKRGNIRTQKQPQAFPPYYIAGPDGTRSVPSAFPR